MRHFNESQVFQLISFSLWQLVSSATKNGRKWSPTAWWTSCQEPSPRPPKSRNPARVREQKKSRRSFFLGWNQNESKMHQKHRNGWKIRKNKTKQIDFFVVFPQKINQEGESERGELNKYTNQKSNWSHTACLFIYIVTSIVWPGDQSQLIERLLKGSKDECILFDSNDPDTLYDLHTRTKSLAPRKRSETKTWSLPNLIINCLLSRAFHASSWPAVAVGAMAGVRSSWKFWRRKDWKRESFPNPAFW